MENKRNKKRVRINKKKLFLAIVILIIIIVLLVLIISAIIKHFSKSVNISSDINVNDKVEIVVENKEENKEVAKENTKEEILSKIEVKNGITYVNGVLLVNKKYNLPKDYNPGVNATANAAFEEMRKAASKDKISLTIVSGFRSYNTQKSIYNSNLQKHGEKIANRFSAKAGQSEHQTGLAFDLNKANRSFVGTKEAKWIADNCYKYGFILRYPEGKEAITGYVYEPWHVRYVGKDVAKKIYEQGVCLEEYLGVN